MCIELARYNKKNVVFSFIQYGFTLNKSKIKVKEFIAKLLVNSKNYL